MLVDDSFQFGFVSFLRFVSLRHSKLFRFQVDAVNNPDTGAMPQVVMTFQ